MSGTPTRLGWLWVILATVIVAVFGLVSMGMWIPAVMMFDAPGSTDKPLVWFFAVYSSVGPVVAILGLVVGWIRVFLGQRGRGVKWMLLIPLVWLVSLIGIVLAASAICTGDRVCEL